MAAKKSKNSMGVTLLCTLAIAVGIYFVVVGVLSGDTDNWRSFMIALGMGIFASGTIGFSTNK